MASHLTTSRGTRPTALEAMRMGSQNDPAMEHQRLSIILEPASPDDAIETIAFLFKVLPMENQGETEAEKDEIAEAMIAAYKLALRGYPRWAIREARDAFIAGKVEGYSSSFAPRPPDFGREVARRCNEMQEKMARMARQARENEQFRVEERTGPRSPQSRAFGERRIVELRAISDADRQRHFGRKAETWVDPRPITDEQMAALPDAPQRDGNLRRPPVPDTFTNLRSPMAKAF